MSDIKLFDIQDGKVEELEGQSVALEKSLQHLIERNMETFLGVRFLSSEHNTGQKHGGRIDTLGIDENGCPVIIEYKRAVNENVINQGLFYLDWLMDHKAEFQWLVMEKLGKEEAEGVEWASPRLICIAGDFTRYDEHAVQQINRNIELVRYRKYGEKYLLLELVNAVQATGDIEEKIQKPGAAKHTYKTASEFLEAAPEDLKNRFEALKAFLLALGDDIQLKPLKFYFAFKRIKNFACVEVRPQNKVLLIYTKVDPATIDLESYGKDFIRDVREIGHYGTGDLEVTIRSDEDLEKAKPLILKSYENS